MLFGNKKNKEEKKKVNTIEKVLMGAVIGGAIGSVVGASIAPKKGKETRKEVSEAVKKATQTSGTFFSKIKNHFTKKQKEEREKGEDMKKIPTEEK